MKQDITIWHNQQCSKSRNAMAALQERGVEPNVIKYLENPPTREEIVEVIKMLGIGPRELMRTGEDIYKELRLKDETDEEKLIDAMAKYPRLIERPVVIANGKAAIGRPLENVISILK